MIALSGLILGASFMPSENLQTFGFSELRKYAYAEMHMGVKVEVTLFSKSKELAEKAAKAAYDRIAELNDTFSTYNLASEASRLNSSPARVWLKTSPDMAKILKISTDLSRRTNGMFDITVGPFVDLWKIARDTTTLPDTRLLTRAKSKVGWELLKLKENGGLVYKSMPGMALDFGGIVKGYAMDEAIDVISKAGVKSAMVQAGGDLKVSGPPPGEKGWKIGVFGFKEDQHVRLVNMGMSTSGDYYQFVDIKGVRYSHIVDPRTGLGTTSGVAVTVMADKALYSDAMATAGVVNGRFTREFGEGMPYRKAFNSWLEQPKAQKN